MPGPHLGRTPRYTQPPPIVPLARLTPPQYHPSSLYSGPNAPHREHTSNSHLTHPPRARRKFVDWVFRPCERASSWAGASRFQIHPLLNGEAHRAEFYFNLANPIFSPLRVGPRNSTFISADELRGLATYYPSVTRMRITHEAIPQWPIDVKFDHDAATQITLGDVLYMIHASLHKGITKQDWDRISPSVQTAIARAYTQRCWSAPSPAVVRSQGVKRIDYLLGEHAFKGLIRTRDGGSFHRWRLITAY